MARSETNGSPVVEQQEPVAPSDNEENAAVVRVHQALKRLSTSGREVIQLHYFSGFSYEEIARALGISPQAVHGRMRRARRILAARLTEND